MYCDIEYFHLSVTSCSKLSKSLPRYPDHMSNYGFYGKRLPCFYQLNYPLLTIFITVIPTSVIFFTSPFRLGEPTAFSVKKMTNNNKMFFQCCYKTISSLSDSNNMRKIEEAPNRGPS